MAQLRAELKRSFLQSIADAVNDQIAVAEFPSTVPDLTPIIVSLEDGLKAFQRMQFEALKSGRLSLGSSGLDHEVRWAAPQQWRSFTQDEVMALAQELREIHSDALIKLSANGNGSPTGQQILAAMFADDRLQSVSSINKDFTLLRWNQRY